MFQLVKNALLKQKQAQISGRFPDVKIVLHPDMPQPSMGKIVSLVPLVSKVNAL